MKMPNERSEPPRSQDSYFELETSDDWQESYGHGGPVRSDEPERDYFFESTAAPTIPGESGHRRRRMPWDVDEPPTPLRHRTDTKSTYRGKGPKGYRPSDERLRERICERLTDDPFIDATDLEVSVANGEVTVTGAVPVRRMKFAIEDLVSDIAGVTALHNSIRTG
jgi:hypothetical protein